MTKLMHRWRSRGSPQPPNPFKACIRLNFTSCDGFFSVNSILVGCRKLLFPCSMPWTLLRSLSVSHVFFWWVPLDGGGERSTYVTACSQVSQPKLTPSVNACTYIHTVTDSSYTHTLFVNTYIRTYIAPHALVYAMTSWLLLLLSLEFR